MFGRFTLRISIWIALIAVVAIAGRARAAIIFGDEYLVGAAQIDITPKYPIRLSGFGFRRAESEGLTQRIWAKALAIGADDPALLITVDTCGVSADIVREVANRLTQKAGIVPARLAVTATHTHTAPMLKGVVPTLFGQPIPQDHQERIDRYTIELTDNLEKVALAALADRRPAKLKWGIGQVGFAVNRRTKGGPVDHDLPVLVAQSLDGKVRAIYVNYACHCVTLSHNKIGGDWAGFAQQAIQDAYPGAVALVSIGCGADANPSSGVANDRVEFALQQGKEIAAEVRRLVRGYLTPVSGKPTTTLKIVSLPLAALPSRADWQTRAARNDAIGHHARVNLARLDHGEKLKTHIVYPIQTWAFGDSLAMVFLPGEVVVDYSVRLKRELDGRRLWINAYANDAPAYIPSERILREGGYEGGGAMVYYDVPVPFKPGLEQSIVKAVLEPLMPRFASPFEAQKVGNVQPLSPQRSRSAIRTRSNLTVDLVAAEPLVIDPVAIDFGTDGRLWVAEMYDYPSGRQGDFQPGGRVRVLEDTDGDGIYDKSTVFLDNIPFPTGITVWRNGVLVCAAPDILYAVDSDGDGKADLVRKLFSGFGTDNYQGRVNSLEYGLDNWVYGSCGLYGGTIRNHAGKSAVALGDRDFRIKPDEGILEPASGRTQQGRVRDDWGNWFGCDNSVLCRHYPLSDQYLRRNPHVAPPVTEVYVPDYPNSNRLFPILRHLQVFKLSGPPGRTTAACGLGIYRDNLLGPDFAGNAFVCEPVNLLVHRLQLSPRGSTFSGRRASDESDSEFLASTDNWFRPVQVRTGPDGALWVVDMYRFVIEHPRWVPPEDLAKLDVRAGSTMGRIYRVRPKDAAHRAVPRLDKLDDNGLVAALDSANGWQRDMAGQMLLWRNAQGAAKALEKLFKDCSRAEARLSALCILHRLGKMRAEIVLHALRDPHAGIRRHAVRLAESFVAGRADVGQELLRLTNDEDAQVRLQLAYSLGEWRDSRVGQALAKMVRAHVSDIFLRTAVLSSVTADNVGDVLAGTFEDIDRQPPPAAFVEPLLRAVAAMGVAGTTPTLLPKLLTQTNGRFAAWQMQALAGMLDGLGPKAQGFLTTAPAKSREQLRAIGQQAKEAVLESNRESDRHAGLQLLGRGLGDQAAERATLSRLLAPQQPAAIQAAALTALGRFSDDSTAKYLLESWKGLSPRMQAQVLDLMLTRPNWQDLLLQAVESRTIPPGQIDARRRQHLLMHRHENVRKLAAKLFQASAISNRQQVVADYKDVAAIHGDRGRGKSLFAVRCATCHRLDDVGYSLGPDLAALKNKSPLYLLTEILDPNQNVDTRYMEYFATTKTGRTFTGVLDSETATSISLQGQEGKEQVLLRSELDELQSTGKSLMPEGLEKDLSRQDLADVISYLIETGTPPKRFSGNAPTVVRLNDNRLTLLATQAEIHGKEIAFEPEFRNIGMWHGLDDYAVWRVQMEKDTAFDVYLDWACHDGSAGNAFVFDGAEPALRGRVRGTGGWDHYRQEKIGAVRLRAGLHFLSFRPEGDRLRGALIDLRGIHLVAQGQQPQFFATEVADDPAALARQILNDKLPQNERQALINRHPTLAPALVSAMVADLTTGTKEEYRRIPWIWRVAIAAGRRNDLDQLRQLLDASLPKDDEPLRDWQAVVIGGGIINGISLQGVWPQDRLHEMVRENRGRAKRWQRTLDQAATMVDNDKVPTGTRYDALRIVAMDDWEKSGELLAKYLRKGVHDELQMGAISALSDMKAPRVAELLLPGFGHYSAENRKLAVDALLRLETRTILLLDAVSKGKIKGDVLSDAQLQALRESKNEAIRRKARQISERQ